MRIKFEYCNVRIGLATLHNISNIMQIANYAIINTKQIIFSDRFHFIVSSIPRYVLWITVFILRKNTRVPLQSIHSIYLI